MCCWPRLIELGLLASGQGAYRFHPCDLGRGGSQFGWSWPGVGAAAVQACRGGPGWVPRWWTCGLVCAV